MYTWPLWDAYESFAVAGYPITHDGRTGLIIYLATKKPWNRDKISYFDLL